MKVYISTNKEQPANCFEVDEEKIKVLSIVSGLNTTSPLKVANDVFLIHQDLASIAVDKENSCLLHHTKISLAVKEAFDSRFVKPGMHEQAIEGLYAPVFKILLNESIKDKHSEILKVLGFSEKEIKEKETLETKLNLLHHCLTPEGAKTPEVIENYYLIKDLIEEVKWGEKTVVEHLAEQTNCFDEDNYLKPLTKLRDALLS